MSRSETIAMDRSVRRYDADGHMFVETSRISKANVCPYAGREIPNYQRLGLDADRIYNLYRDPRELEKAADSFAGKPLLLQHKPISADDHPRDIVVGSIGDKVEFKAPYLIASLNVWDGQAIRLIETDKQKELSCGYRYEADMTPGRVDGKTYDGRMTNIQGNHLTLCAEGRAGPDVVVGDEAMRTSKERHAPMRKKTARRLAYDENEIDSPSAPQGIPLAALRQLAEKMSPEGWAVLHEALNEDSETEGAEDEPPDFKGKPEVGKRPPAMDSAAGLRFAEMYPGASQIKTDTMGIQPRPRHVTTSAKAVARFEEMYPDAMRIKHL